MDQLCAHCQHEGSSVSRKPQKIEQEAAAITVHNTVVTNSSNLQSSKPSCCRTVCHLVLFTAVLLLSSSKCPGVGSIAPILESPEKSLLFLHFPSRIPNLNPFTGDGKPNSSEDLPSLLCLLSPRDAWTKPREWG